MYGYLTFYFKVKINNENHYAKYTSDFAKPITEEFAEMVKKLIYEAFSPKGKIEEIKFCSEEEYVKNTIDMNNTSIKWDEDKIWVEETNNN